MHALYGFTRYADEIVDRTAHLPVDGARGACWPTGRERFIAGLRRRPTSMIPLLPAVLHTIAAFDLDLDDFAAFLRSMAMDLTVTSYATYDDLLDYMEGSAAVIGTMMLPILGADRPGRPPASRPASSGSPSSSPTSSATSARISTAAGSTCRRRISTGSASPARSWPPTPRGARPPRRSTALIEYEVQRARRHYAAAAPGVTMLARRSQACIRTAYHLYGGILDEVVAAGYDVFVRRATVPTARRLRVALRCLLLPATAGRLG